MAEHILIACATRRPNRTAPALHDDVWYDAASGYWTKDGVPWVLDGEHAQASKKCDQETGEDQKGE